MSEALILYRAGDPDAIGAAWLFKRCRYPNATFQAMKPGSKPEHETAGRDVIAIGIVPNRAAIETLRASARSFLAIARDDKARASLRIEDAEPAGLKRADQFPSWAMFDNGKGLARMAWEFLRRTGATPFNLEPAMIPYLQDAAMGKFQMKDSAAINAAIESHGDNFASWDWLQTQPISQVAIEGRGILRWRALNRSEPVGLMLTVNEGAIESLKQQIENLQEQNANLTAMLKTKKSVKKQPDPAPEPELAQTE